ncbi:MAG: hypothetical protein Q8877_02815, partial [Sweet potato little leaf phytoplasma]|nr:hypothetical protein [Sweet potato little leaf phytoplasma]
MGLKEQTNFVRLGFLSGRISFMGELVISSFVRRGPRIAGRGFTSTPLLGIKDFRFNQSRSVIDHLG